MGNSMRQILALIGFEFERAFMRKQSLIYLAAFGFLWYLIIRIGLFSIDELIPEHGDLVQRGETVLTSYYKIGLYVFSILVMLATANQSCSDRVRGTLRFLALRCHRDTLFLGRYLSQVLIFTVLITSVSVALFFAVSIKVGFDLSLLVLTLAYTFSLILNILPFVALMAVLSVQFDSARQVSVIALLVWALASSIISGLTPYAPPLAMLEYLVPGMQYDQLLNLHGLELLTLSYIPVGQAVVLLFIGVVLMRRKAL